MIEYRKTGEDSLNVADKVLYFEYEVKKVVELNDILIVLLGNSDKYKSYGKESDIPFNGIYAVSSKGKILWNIEVLFRPGRLYNETNIEIDYKFIDIIIDNDENLLTYTNTGKVFILDINKKQIIGHFISERKRKKGEYNIRRNDMLEIGGKEINFNYYISKVIETDSILIVHLWNKSMIMYKEPINGIYGVSQEGEILWNIEEFFRPDAGHAFNCFPLDYFIDAKLNDEGYLVVETYAGNRYMLDIDRMKIIDQPAVK